MSKAFLALVASIFLLGNVGLAQPVAKIVGPPSAPPGEMVVLSSTGSVGDNLVWVRPDTIQTIQVGCTVLDTQIFFSTTKLGVYQFLLIAADKEARIAYDEHLVEIKAGGGGGTPPPVDPPAPNPAKWAPLLEISKQGANKVNDPPTRTKLKSSMAATTLAIQAKCDAGQCPPLPEAKSVSTKTIETVLLGRTGPSALMDWTSWRKANQAEIDRLGIVDVADYVGALKAISAGL